jgi:hypothetical protein
MEKVYVHDIRDENTLETLIKWYDQYSTTAAYIRNEIMALYRKRRRSRYKVPLTWSLDIALPLVEIVCNRPLEVTGSIGNKTAW